MIPYFVSVAIIGLSVAQAAVYRLPVSVDWTDKVEARAILYEEGFRREISVTVLPSRGTMLIAGPQIGLSNVAIHLENENGVGPGLFHIEDSVIYSEMHPESILLIEEIVPDYRSISLIHNYSNNTNVSIFLGMEFADFAERYCLPGSSLLLPRPNRRVEFSISEPMSGSIRRLETQLGYYVVAQRLNAVCSLPFEWYNLIFQVITSSGSVDQQAAGLFSNCYPSLLNQLSPITIRFIDSGDGQSTIVIQPEDYLVFDTSRDGFCYLKILPMSPEAISGQRLFLNTFALRGVNTFMATGVRQICDSSVV